jgi:hypothetical protein
MSKLRTVLLSIVLLATGVYFVLYLYGWEWYRAFVVGIVFLAAEQAAMGIHFGSMIRKGSLAATDRQGVVTPRSGRHLHDGQQAVADVLHASPRRYHDTFRWLRPETTGAPVFIPLLLGAGVFMSGLAWVLEHLAGAVYGGRIDASLARMVSPLMPPEDLLDIPTAFGLLGHPGEWDALDGGTPWRDTALSLG